MTSDAVTSRWPLKRWHDALLLLGAPLLIYAQSLPLGLLGIDDSLYYLNYTALHCGHWPGPIDVWRAPFASEYFPVTALTLWTDLALFGDHAWTGARMQQLLWFGLSVLALRSIVERLTQRRGFAFSVALVYAFHPVCAESVLWLAQRKNVVAMALAFWSFDQYIAFRNAPDRSAGVRAYGAAVLLLIGALLSKSQAVCVPGLLCAYEILCGRSQLRAKLLALAPFVLLTGAFVAANIFLFREDLSGMYLGGSRAAAAASSGPIALRYLAHTLCPLGLAFYYGVIPREAGSLWGLGAWLLLALAMMAATLVCRDRKLAALGWMLGLAAVLPALNLVPQPIPMTDHYQHWALPGWILACAVLAETLLARMPRLGLRGGIALTTACCVAFAALDAVRTPLFGSSLALLQNAAAQRPDSAWAHVSYAGALFHQDDANLKLLAGVESLRALESPDATLINPIDRAFALTQAALYLHRLGKSAEAQALVDAECAKIPSPLLARVTRATVLLRTGNAASAAALLRDDFEANYAGPARSLRESCRGGAAQPDALPPIVQIQSSHEDEFSSTAASELAQHLLFVVSVARLQSGENEGAFDAAIVLGNLAPKSMEAYTALKLTYARLNLARPERAEK